MNQEETRCINPGLNIIVGTDNSEKITGTWGDDIIIGGKGNDVLKGCYGNDTYVFRSGDGIDKVINFSLDGAFTTDKIVFEDVYTNDVSFYRQGQDLIIVYSADGWSDRVHVSNFFCGKLYEVNEIQFPDGTYTASDMNSMLKGAKNTYFGTDGNDKITGSLCDDIIIGGKGNDILKGGFGNDTYIFSKGDGIDEVINFALDGASTTDIIQFTNVYSNEAEFFREGKDLIIVYADDYYTDRIHLTGFFNGKLYEVNEIQFLDQTIYANELKDTLKYEPNTHFGTNGNDRLKGMKDYNVFYGGKGDDVLIGGDNNLYMFSKGDGNDQIINYSFFGARYTDRVKFTDVASYEVSFYRQNKDLIVVYSDDMSDMITLTDYFRGARYEVDTIEFTDTFYSTAKINEMLKSAPSTYFGADGNDKIKGTSGDDILIGGKGNDRLEGGRGNDTYIFSKGDGIDEVVNYAIDGASTTDIIRFTNVDSMDADFYRQGNDLIITYSEDFSDRIHLTNFFRGKLYAVNRIEFTDYTYDAADLIYLMQNEPNTYFGTGGNDRIKGSSGDDVFIGGKGDDVITGGGGNDLYIFSKGDGIDQVINYSFYGARTADRVQFTDVSADEAVFFRNGNDLIIEYARNGSDQVHLTDFFRGARYEVNMIEFTDRIYLREDIEGLLLQPYLRAFSLPEETVSAPTIDQELHSMINAMAAFDPSINSEDLIAANDLVLTQPLIATSSF